MLSDSVRRFSRAAHIFACAAVAVPVLAAAAAQTGAVVPARDAAAMEQARAGVQGLVALARAGSKPGAATVGGASAHETFVNVLRAYPPSCLNAPMPLGMYVTDPNALQASVRLIGDPYNSNATEQNYNEAVTITVWRVVCSNGTDGSGQTIHQSASLLEIDRPAINENTFPYPTFPGVSVQQGSTNLNVRIPDDPNTFYSTTYPVTPLVGSDVYVLENYYSNTTPQFDFNAAFDLTIDNFNLNDPNRLTTFHVPAYNPANYADATKTLPISGYMSTNWFDPAHSGEGMLVQVYDNGDNTTRTFTAAWYTFDNFGLPFWLYAQGTINIGDRTTGNVDTYYATNGGFAGNFGSTADFTKWGTINISFPDCNHMNFSFNGATDAQTNGPAGSGTRNGWTRLANINSLVCD